MIIDKLYYKSPLGMEWKEGGLSFVASYLSEFSSYMIAPNGSISFPDWCPSFGKISVPPFAQDALTKLTTTTSFFYLIDVFAR